MGLWVVARTFYMAVRDLKCLPGCFYVVSMRLCLMSVGGC